MSTPNPPPHPAPNRHRRQLTATLAALALSLPAILTGAVLNTHQAPQAAGVFITGILLLAGSLTSLLLSSPRG